MLTSCPSLALWSLVIVANTVPACSPPITEIRALGPHVKKNEDWNTRTNDYHNTADAFLIGPSIFYILWLARALGHRQQSEAKRGQKHKKNDYNNKANMFLIGPFSSSMLWLASAMFLPVRAATHSVISRAKTSTDDHCYLGHLCAWHSCNHFGAIFSDTTGFVIFS